jgi:hypothetical protein
VRLTPKGGRDHIEGWSAGADGTVHLKARVAAPPDKGRANRGLLALLAAELHIAKSAIAIRSGETSRLKTIVIEPDSASVLAKLEAFGEAR